MRHRRIRFPLFGCILLMVLFIMGTYCLKASAKDDSIHLSGRDQLMLLIQISLNQQDITSAQDYLDKLYQQEGDSPDTALIAARIQMLKGNYEDACLLYEKAELLGIDIDFQISPAEKDFYQNIRAGRRPTPSDSQRMLTMASYLKEQNLNPEDYGYPDDALMSAEQIGEEILYLTSIVNSALQESLTLIEQEQSSESDLVRTALTLASVIHEQYNDYIQYGFPDDTLNFDEDLVKKSLRDLSRIYRKSPSLFHIEEIDLAYIKGHILLKDYESLIQYAESFSSQNALASVANLYISGQINEDDFDRDFFPASKYEYSQVIDRCEDALYTLEDKSADDSLIRELDRIVEQLALQKSHPVLAALDIRIQPETTEPEVQSKLYLQKTNVNYNLGDHNRANQSFQSALDTALHSNDLNYTEPMRELLNILQDNSDSEEIKNAELYINQAYTHSSPFPSSADASAAQSFTQKATEFISTKKAMVNIGKIDTKEFPLITANVQFASPLHPADPQLSLSDCSQDIKDFTVKKQASNKLRVYLVCDISGSMAGSEGDLQSAVRQFISNMTSREEVALLGFSGSVEFSSGFTSNAKDLESYIERLHPGGGTNIGAAAYYSIDQFPQDENVSNVIILMTDGNDDSFSSSASLIELKQRCEEKNIMLYAIGLGSGVSTEYLTNIANYGNGRFVYSNDSVNLQSLYDFIHRQIDNNYLITYNALNQTDVVRELLITNSGDSSSGSKKYRLSYDSIEDETEYPDSENSLNIQDLEEGIVVTGINTSMIYKGSGLNSSFDILGKGFAGVKNLRVSLEGSVHYNNLKASVSNDQQIHVELDSKVQIGTYSVVITLDQQSYRLKDALQISLSGKEKTLEFGAYQFTAQAILQTGDTCILRGNVVMNDYLHFRGDVTLTGDLNSLQVRMTESSGSYISFSRPLPGLLKTFYGNTVHLPPLGTLTIYNDQVHLYDLDNYMTEQAYLSDMNCLALVFEQPYFALYPHMIKLSFGSLNFDFPLQKEFMEWSGADNPFTVSGNSHAVINGDTIAAVGSFSATKDKQIKFSVLSFHLSEVELEFNTLEHDYMLKMMVQTEKLVPSLGLDGKSDDASYGFDIEIKQGKFDAINLRADFPITVVAAPPVSLSDFAIGVSGMSSLPQDAGLGSIITNLTFTGSTDISVAKLSDLIKVLGPIFGDLSLVTFDDTTLSLRLSNLLIHFNTTVKLLGEFEIGDAEVTLGEHQYSNYLLGIPETETSGFILRTSSGLKLDLANFKIDMDGNNQITINNQFTGIWSNGLTSYDIKFFGRHKNVVDGSRLMGLHNNGKQFTLLIKSSDLKKNQEAGIRVTFSSGKWLPDITLY